MITKFGKRFLTNHLAGNVDFKSKDIAFGIGTTTPNALGNDTKLEFEFYRTPSTLGSIDIKQTSTDGQGNPVFSYTAIFMATIPQDVSGVITEMGIYPSARQSINNYDSKFITAFEDNTMWTDGSFSPATQSNSSSFLSRIGENMVRFDLDASEVLEYYNDNHSYDFSGYSINDSISIAYKLGNDNVSNIRIKLYSTNTAYCWVDFVPPLIGSNSDKIQQINLSTLFSNITSPGPDLSSISKIGIEVTAKADGPAVIYFDGIRINDEDTFDPQYGLVSRSLLTKTTTISGSIGSNTINVGSSADMFIGQPVSGTGIAAGAKITAISGNAITLSANNTAAVSGNGTFVGFFKPSGRPVDIEYKVNLGF